MTTPSPQGIPVPILQGHAFAYPISVYLPNGVTLSNIASTTFLLPVTANEGDCLILISITGGLPGLYIWHNAGWIRLLGDKEVSAASIFRHAILVFIDSKLAHSIRGDLYLGAVILTPTSVIPAGLGVYLNVVPTEQNAFKTLQFGSSTEYPLHFTNNPTTGLFNNGFLNISRQGVGLILKPQGVRFTGKLESTLGFRVQQAIPVRLGVAYLQVTNIVNPSLGVTGSTDGGVTFYGFRLPAPLNLDGTTTVLKCLINQTLIMNFIPANGVNPSLVSVSSPSSFNVGCTVVDTGVSTDLLGRTFTITVNAAVANAYVTFTLGAQVINQNIRISTTGGLIA